MPALAAENCPVPAQAASSLLSTTAAAPPPASSLAALYGKATTTTSSSPKRSGPALAPVDSNAAASVHGPRRPSRPAPSPPSPRRLQLADDHYHRTRSFSDDNDADDADDDDGASSAASSADMTSSNGGSARGGSGGAGSSSSGGAASSHATTVPPDEDPLRLNGSLRSLAAKDAEADRGHRPASPAAHSLSSPAIPQRAPPPPPQKPPSPTLLLLPSSASPLARPDAPSQAPPPPPPPPKPDAVTARKTKPQLSNGVGPVCVPNPMAVPQSQSQPSLSSDSARQQRPPWTNGVSSSAGEGEPTSPPGPPEPAASSAAAAETAAAWSHQRSLSPSPNAQLLQPGHAPVPPHRFSSPPAYNPGGAASSHPPSGAGLKHRHTLEVPKVSGSGSRNSREGLDAAGGVFASGRFSPTAAGASGSGSSIGGRRASLSLVRRNTRSLHSEVPRDEIIPDEDAIRWAEAYRQKRASKKRRMEDDDQVLVGTKVDETHQNWVAAYNMLTGIRVSVSRTNAKLDRPLTDEDFEAKQKSTFDIAGNELVPSAKYDFKFKDYAPWVFRHLRALFHLDPADYLMSLAGKYILSELGSPGKSGSFFYFSRDYRYIIKTIHHAEHKFLRKILKDYYRHVTENPNTLLSQFFGLHRVKMPYGRKIHFVVMNNLFPPHRDIHQTFDLKGSTIGRDYPEELLSQNPRATLKDLNWLRRHQHLELGIVKKRLFLEQLRKDVQLLQRLQIMDYSLLVGTHDLRRGNEENLRGKILQVFEPGGDNTASENNNGQGSSGVGGVGGGSASGGGGGGGGGGGNLSTSSGPADAGGLPPVLMRTPSKLEHMRKTRELREMLKAERPIPIGQSSNKMPDELDDNRQSIFYQDDGGFRATHEDNTPAEEVYYLGVIDCLTHYGIVKKIEHFWKGLSHDRNQISALPPQQYGERFLEFMSGITMSPEDAAQEAHERASTAANADAVGHAAADGQDAGVAVSASGRDRGGRDSGQHGGGGGGGGGGGWTSSLRHRSGSNRNSDDSRREATTAHHRAAEHEAQTLSPVNDSEAAQTTIPLGGGMLLPNLVGGTGGTGGSGAGSSPSLSPPSPSAAGGERRESMQQPALPIVEEAGENSSTGGRSRSSRLSSHTTESDGRPLTPAKDGDETGVGIGTGSPPTPTAAGYLKPDTADSGYGVSGGTRSRSGTLGSGRKVKVRLSRESLDKDLPPLPKLDRAA